MRLGILQCDTVHEDLQGDFGDYPGMFLRLLDGPDQGIDFRIYNLTRGEFPADVRECDAWLITGSKWSVYDPEDWIQRGHQLVRELHDARRPTVGICFGHQMIARALGGRVDKAAVGWGVGVHTARIIRHRPWMQPSRETLPLLVSHQDQVTELPPGAVRLAGHDFCPYDMFDIGDHIITFQGHPEFIPDYSRATMERRREIIGEDTYRRGIASLEQSIEDAVAARWILRFLGQATAQRNRRPA